MAEGQSYYITQVGALWRLKKIGGTKVLREFQSEAEALSYAQEMIANQKATISLQNSAGVWREI